MKNKLSIFILMSVMMLSTAAQAKWTYDDQVNKVNNEIKDGTTQLDAQIAAQGIQAAAYAVVGRSNDIFTFCREGVPTDFWVGVNPSSGTYQITNPWYVKTQWIPFYVRICPFGGPITGVFLGGPSGGAFIQSPQIPNPAYQSPVVETMIISRNPAVVAPMIPFPH